jgi:oligosaccharide repeat unit polymerase
MVTLLAIAALTLFAGLSYYIGRSLIYPPFAMAACWASFLAFLACSRSYLFGLHDETALFFVIGVLAFCTGGVLTHYLYRPYQRRVSFDPTRVRKVLDVLLGALLVAFPFYWHFITELVSAGQTQTFWVALRGALIDESTEALSGFSVMDNVVVLADLTVILAWYHRDRYKWRAWAAFSFFVVYNVLTAGRAGFVFVILCLFTMEVLKARKIPWRAIAVLVLVFAIAFFGLAILVRKAGATPDASLADNIPVLVEGFQLYTIGGLVAFDNLYQHPSAIQPTQNIDRNFRIAVNKLGWRTTIPYLHAEFSTVGPSGVDMNVYTIYFSYFPQLGTAGSLLLMCMLGAGVTFAYLKAITGGPQAVIIFAILFYAIPLSGYAEYYFMNLNFLGKMVLLTFVCYGFSSRQSATPLPC